MSYLSSQAQDSKACTLAELRPYTIRERNCRPAVLVAEACSDHCTHALLLAWHEWLCLGCAVEGEW
jgi:hypothetical protein